VDEPKTNADIVRGLLTLALEREWIDADIYCGRSCHCLLRTVKSCVFCNGEGEHEGNCRAAATLREARAFLAVEDPDGGVP
jgi:hypothetical protein